MSTRRWAGAGFVLFAGCFAVAGGCGGDDSNPGGDGGLGGDSGAACSTTVTGAGCLKVRQNGVEFDLGCSSIVNKTINGRPVCAGSGACVGNCLDPMTVYSCLDNCRPKVDGGGDGGAGPLGASCMTTADCGGGLTCLKPTDNIVPGSGPPNGICTADCSSTANHDLCISLRGICVSFAVGAKAYCLESCETGPTIPPGSKCHARHDTACAPLDPAGFACVPLCATNADCGTRKCDLGTGLCADFITPGAPIGSPCSFDSDCAGAICYPFAISDAAASPGVCTALCRLGNIEGCGFRTSPIDAGPPIGACLLATSDADEGDTAICAQLCDSVADCTTQDSRWTCVLDSRLRTTYRHGGYCWLGAGPDGGIIVDGDGGRTDVSADRTVPTEAGPPETGAPETGAPEASVDATPESGGDATPPDGNTSDGSGD